MPLQIRYGRTVQENVLTRKKMQITDNRQPLKVITKVTITKKELSHEKATFEIYYEESTYNEKWLK